MAKYRKVSVYIWNDKNFRAMSDDGQLIFLFILTHQTMTGIGAMRTTLEGLSAEKKWPLERLSKAFGEAVHFGMIKYDPENLCLIMPNFIKHNMPESPNVVTGWEKALELVPESPLKYEQLQHIGKSIESLSEGFQKAFRRLSDRKAYGRLPKEYG